MYVRLTERVHTRVHEAATNQGMSLSSWLRRAVLAHLDDASREASERAALLAEARRFLAGPVGDRQVDRDGHRLIERYVAAIEAQAGRLGMAEARGRQRALAEIAQGALEPLDGEELTFGEFRPDTPVVLELAASPRRRGFLKATLAAERARALLQEAPAVPPAPSAADVLGEARVRELWNQVASWPGRRLAFCPQHGMALTAPGDGDRCYLGCRIPGADDGPEAA
jgi:hypothetical protein